MEKISRIIPPSARTKSYDVTRAQPGRPGAPTIGRPQSMNVIEDRMTLSDQYLDPIMKGDTLPTSKVNESIKETYQKPIETVKSQIVKDLTNKFFAKENPKDLARDSDQTQSEEVASRVHSSSGSSVNVDSSKDVSL